MTFGSSFWKKGSVYPHTLICIFKSNITMIAKVCDREIRWDSWFENRLVLEPYQMWWVNCPWRCMVQYSLILYLKSKLSRDQISVRLVKPLRCMKQFCLVYCSCLYIIHTLRVHYAHAAANLNSEYSKYAKVARVLYFCTIALRTSRAVLTRAWAWRRVDLRERRVDLFSKRVIICCW